MKKNTLIMVSGATLLALTAQTSVALAEEITQNLNSNGITEFIPGNDPVDPVDPVDPDPDKPVVPWDPTTPDNKPEPGTEGPLSLDFASSFDFGVNEISNKDMVYMANPQYFWNEEGTGKDEEMVRPNYVQITDNRGTNEGWTLNLKQETQFKNDSATHKELNGSVIDFVLGTPNSKSENKETESPVSYGYTITPGESVTVMSATEGAGAGTWTNAWGDVEEVSIKDEKVLKNTGVKLKVPGKTVKDAVKYTTQFTWTLTNVPGNK